MTSQRVWRMRTRHLETLVTQHPAAKPPHDEAAVPSYSSTCASTAVGSTAKPSAADRGSTSTQSVQHVHGNQVHTQLVTTVCMQTICTHFRELAPSSPCFSIPSLAAPAIAMCSSTLLQNTQHTMAEYHLRTQHWPQDLANQHRAATNTTRCNHVSQTDPTSQHAECTRPTQNSLRSSAHCSADARLHSACCCDTPNKPCKHPTTFALDCQPGQVLHPRMMP